MSGRRLPVRPDLTQLKHQAKDLLRAVRRGEAEALGEFRQFHPNPPNPADAKLADAQLALARAYGASSWPRVVQCCTLIDAIWADDVDTVRELVLAHPYLLHENAGIRNNNWGPPLAYASNLGRDRIITMLHQLGAQDLKQGIGRAVLQGRIGTARMLHRMLGAPNPRDGALGGPAYTLSVSGTEFLFEIGARAVDEQGRPLAPVDIVLESDSRKPEAVHRIFELYEQHGYHFPDTPIMALFRGRLDLVEAHVQRDPGLLTRSFSYEEIFPPSLGCHPEELPRTTLDGATLLHLCVEFEELAIARRLLELGMSADVPAAVDQRGFGGHTALFQAVVGYPNFWMNFTGGWAHSRKPRVAPFAELLLDRGANPNARASLRERIKRDGEETFREHRDLTPLGWGEVFHNRLIVSEPAMRLIEQRGGAR